jgi:hypothetical protein
VTDQAVLAALAALQESFEKGLKDLQMEVAALREQRAHGPVDGLIGIERVCEILDVEPRTLRRIRAGRGFPKPVKRKGRPKWRRRDIVKYAEGSK